jgi:diguanylate cyclase (GGDEF)-like protein
MEFKEKLNARWRKELFQICVVFAIMGSIAEIVIYLWDAHYRTLFLPQDIYRARFIYIPSTLNLLVIIITYFFLKGRHFSDAMKNLWACLLIYFLCANTQVIHYVYGPLLMLPCVAIFVTILFSNRRLTLGVFLASYVSLSVAYYQAGRELRKNDPQLNIDTILAALVMLITFIAANLLIGYVSEQINYILASNKRQMKLIEECNMDPLMGIGNRRALSQKLESMKSLSLTGQPPVMMMMDIDDFKQINDTYGHLSGDDVLTDLSDLIRKKIQNHKMEVYRYGGEEIIILFFQTDIERAYHVAEEIRKEFSSHTFSFDKKKKITFSGGMVCFKQNMSTDDWINEADQLMYQAKDDGKNRIYKEMRHQ